jgi:translocation and assembly module TamB
VNLPEGYEPPAGKKEEENQKEAPPLPIDLDLEVSVPGQIFVRGKGVDSDWKGKLTITGTASDPMIVGDLNVERGTVSFVSQTFTITRGVITFDGGRRIDPLLDLVAEDASGDITVRVVVSGRASSPSIALESDPSLPSDEILSRILFDTGTANLSAFQAIQLAQAAASLAGGGGGGFNPIDSMRQALALDRLDVSQEGEDVSGTTLSAGKYITDDIYLSLDQGLTPGSSKVTVEVELTPNLTVESDVGANATGNVGLNWEWDY